MFGGFGADGLNCRAYGLGFRVYGSGFGADGLALRVYDFGFEGWGLGFRVQGFELRVLGVPPPLSASVSFGARNLTTWSEQ